MKIYCIEDCNNLKYVGSTKQKLKTRLAQHKCDKKRRNSSSSKLDLVNCKIYVLEECLEQNTKEREKYWIHKIDCVNTLDLTFDIWEYWRSLYHYKKTWGGDARRNNNLLLIDVDLFL